MDQTTMARQPGVAAEMDVRSAGAATRALTETERRALEVFGLMGALGKKVIHPGGRRSTERLLAMAELGPNQHVLEIGCGVGTTAIQMASRFGCQVRAIDVDPAMVALARANVGAAGLEGRIAVEQGDAVALGYPDESFDRVVVEAVLMFVDRAAAVREIGRVCRTGGYALDHESFFRTPPPVEIVDVCHRELFPGIQFEGAEEWVELYRSAGFRAVETCTGAMDFWAALLWDERPADALRMFGRMLASPGQAKQMAYLIPRMRKVAPYVGYFVLKSVKGI